MNRSFRENEGGGRMMGRRSITLPPELIKHSSECTTETELTTDENIDCSYYDEDDNNNNNVERNNNNDNNNNTLTTENDDAIIIKEKLSSRLSFTKLFKFFDNTNKRRLSPSEQIHNETNNASLRGMTPPTTTLKRHQTT